MIKGFKEFLLRGNIVDLAIAVVIGAAFTALVTAFTSSIVQPMINVLGGPDAANGLGFEIVSGNPSTFVDLGAVINAIITFALTAAVVYFVFVVPMIKVKGIRAKTKAEADAAPAEPSEEVVLLREIRDALTSKN